MKISIDKIARVHFFWVTLSERAKVRRFLTKLRKDGNEYFEIGDSSHQRRDGQMVGSITIEVYEYSLPYIEEYQRKLS